MLQVVLEYERAVIFRLGQLLPGGAKGPGNIVTYTEDTNTKKYLDLCNQLTIVKLGQWWLIDIGVSWDCDFEFWFH